MSKRPKQRSNTGGRRGGPPPRMPNPPHWEELNVGVAACRQRFTIPDLIAPLLNDPVACAAVPNIAELRERAEIIARDIGTFTGKLEAIARTHAGYTGPCTTPDQLMKLLQAAEKYESWGHSFDSVVLPNVDFIVNAFQNCQTKA